MYAGNVHRSILPRSARYHNLFPIWVQAHNGFEFRDTANEMFSDDCDGRTSVSAHAGIPPGCLPAYVWGGVDDYDEALFLRRVLSCVE